MQLLQHFKELTLLPKNAQELKGLILQLAIQGKLTANWRAANPDVEPASELFNRIQKEKAKLIKAKKVRKGKPIDPIKEEEKYVVIPQSWKWNRLIEVGNIFNGNSVNKAVKAAKYEGLEEGLPYLGTKDVNYGFEAINYDNGVKIPFDEPKFKIARKNTALICSEGGSAGKKCGITIKDVCFGNKLYALEQYGNIEAVYILSIYKTPVFFEIFQSKMTGIIGGVSINSFGEIPIPLPPLEEQKEIVKVVETLFKEVEQLEQLTQERISLKEDFVVSALNQLTTNNTQQEWSYLQDHFKPFFNETSNIKKLRESILQLAVQGKLTTHWRSSHPELVEGQYHASELLKRIQKEKAQLIKEKKIKKEKSLPKVTEEEIPYELPDGWVWCRMIDLCQYITDGTHQTPKYTESGRMFISAKNVKPFKFMPEIHKYVSEDDFEGYRRNRKPELNDILLTRVGAGIGEATLIDQDLEFAIYVSVGLLKMFPNKLEPNYIVMWLNSPEGRQYSSKNTYGKGVSQGNLNLSLIRKFVVSLPPLQEQKAIVEKVNAFMEWCDALEQEIQQSQQHSEQLMQSVLREVFEGEVKTVGI